MKRLWLLLLLGLTACASAVNAIETNSPIMNSFFLPDLGPAPEFVNEVWLNTDNPLRLADLRGKVVIVDMWTFG